MNIKSISTAILAAASVSAHAIGPGSIGTIDNTPMLIGNSVPVGALQDEYSFSLTDPGWLYGIAFAANLPPFLNIANFSLTLQDASDSVIGTDINPADGFSFAGLTSGSYTLAFGGSANGRYGGAYGGAIYASTAPVPEPETYALMLVGLAAVGFVARRRRV